MAKAQGTTGTRTRTKRNDDYDAVIGNRLRERRHVLGMSQEELGRRVNLTFQQIQKYEKGSNRISLSRSIGLAKALNIEPSYFFGEETQTSGNGNGVSDKDHAVIREFLSTKDGVRAARAVMAIPNVVFRRQCIEFLESVPQAMKHVKRLHGG